MKLHNSQQENVSVEQLQADSQSKNFSGNTGDNETASPVPSNRFCTSLSVQNTRSTKLLRLCKKVGVYIHIFQFFNILSRLKARLATPPVM